MAETNGTRALHYSDGKAGVDQIPVEPLIAWGEVFSFGERKYGRDNWKAGTAWHEFVGSALRHLLAWKRGEELDPESELNHLGHALWNIGALLYYQEHGIGVDDRPVSISTEYVAGLFDGEGCIVIDRYLKRKKRLRFALRVTITNTDFFVLVKIRKRWGGNITTQPGVNNPIHVWQTGSLQAVQFLKDVVPYLHIKELQAYRAIEFQEEMRPQGGGHPLTAEEIRVRNTAYLDLQDMKREVGADTEIGTDTHDIVKEESNGTDRH